MGGTKLERQCKMVDDIAGDQGQARLFYCSCSVSSRFPRGRVSICFEKYLSEYHEQGISVYYLDSNNIVRDQIWNAIAGQWSSGALAYQNYTTTQNSSLTATYDQCAFMRKHDPISVPKPRWSFTDQ